MIITLTQKPDSCETQLLQKTVTVEDAVLLSPGSMALCLKPNPFEASAFVRQTEISAFQQAAHQSWTLISDQQWFDLILQHEKHISW